VSTRCARRNRRAGDRHQLAGAVVTFNAGQQRIAGAGHTGSDRADRAAAHRRGVGKGEPEELASSARWFPRAAARASPVTASSSPGALMANHLNCAGSASLRRIVVDAARRGTG
jgi:hypothetical protein